MCEEEFLKLVAIYSFYRVDKGSNGLVVDIYVWWNESLPPLSGRFSKNFTNGKAKCNIPFIHSVRGLINIFFRLVGLRYDIVKQFDSNLRKHHWKFVFISLMCNNFSNTSYGTPTIPHHNNNIFIIKLQLNSILFSLSVASHDIKIILLQSILCRDYRWAA